MKNRPSAWRFFFSLLSGALVLSLTGILGWQSAPVLSASAQGIFNLGDSQGTQSTSASSSSQSWQVKVPAETRQVICPQAEGFTGYTKLWAQSEADNPNVKYFQTGADGALSFNSKSSEGQGISWLVLGNLLGGTVIAQPSGDQDTQIVGIVSGVSQGQTQASDQADSGTEGQTSAENQDAAQSEAEAAALAGQTEVGEGTAAVTGVYVDTCRQASTSSYFLIGSTQSGNQNTLTLVNPATASVKATITGFNESGAEATNQQVTLGPGERTSIILDGRFYDHKRVGIQVSSEGKGVVSFLTSQVTLESGLLASAARVPLAAPSKTIYLPATWLSDTSTLQVLNPNDQSAKLDITLISGEETIPLASENQIEVAPGAVFELPVVENAGRWTSIRIESTQVITAQVFDQTQLGDSQPAIVSYPAISTSTSGLLTVSQDEQIAVFTGSEQAQITLQKADQTQQLDLTAGQQVTVELSAGLWQWHSTVPVAAGLIVSGLDDNVAPVISSATDLEQASSVSVQLLP